MNTNELAKALQSYSIQKKLLAPERYEVMGLFRNLLPEVYPKRGPMGPGAPGGAPSGMGGPGDMAASMLATQVKGEIIRDLMAGKAVSNDEMNKNFGFSYTELVEALKENDPVIKPIPAGLVLMTFDDSTIDHYEVACPVLEKYGGKGVMFTTEMHSGPRGAGFEDKTKYMTWEQIRDLSDRGHEIANHSWHHPVSLYTQDDAQILEEMKGIDDRCAAYGIPKPITFGYPGGGCTMHMEELLHNNGYLWGRGERKDDENGLQGSAPYDPYLDTPMVVPNVAAFSEAHVKELLASTEGGKVLLMVKHEVTGPDLSPMNFEALIKAIYDNGGRCITFRELGEYIDPIKAYAYTH